MNEQIAVQERLKNAGKETAQALQNAYAGLGQKTRDELKSLADAALSNFLKIQADGTEPPERLKLLWADALEQIRQYYSTLPDHIKTVNAEVAQLPLPVQPLLDRLTGAFETFGDQSIFAVKKTADNMRLQFELIKNSGLANTEQLQTYWEQTAEAILKAYRGLPADFAEIGDQLTEQGEAGPNALAAAFEEFGSKTQGVMQLTASQSVDKFKLILDAGGQTSQKLLQELHQVVTQINEGEFKTLPEGFQAAVTQFAPVLKVLGLEVHVTRDALGTLRIELDKTGTSTQGLHGKTAELGVTFAKTGQEAEAYAKRLRIAAEQASGLEGSVKGLSAAAIAAGHTLNALGEEVNQYGNKIARGSLETDKLNKLRISVKEDFADDVPGLLTQLGRARTEFSRVQGQGEPPGATGFREFTLKALDQSIDAITAKLKGLGVDIEAATRNPFDQLTAGAVEGDKASTSLTNSLTSANTTLQDTTTLAGKAAGSIHGITGDVTKLAGALSLVSGKNIDPVTGRPFVPGLGSLDPGRPTTGPVNPLPPLASTKAPTITPALAGAVIQGNTVIIAGAPYALVATSPTGGVIFEVGSGQSVPSGALVYDRAARYYYLGDRGSGKVSGTTNGKTLLFPEQSRPTAGSLALIGGYPAPTRATGTGIDPVLLRPVQPVQRFAQGGIVQGSGGTDSVVIRATPGERISTPQQDQARAAAQPAPIIYQTMVHVHLTMQTLVPDRIAPQQIVRTLGPAIQEEINRMQLRMPR